MICLQYQNKNFIIMKKYLLIFLAILSFLSFYAHGQSKLTEQEVKSMLCHKWQPVSMEVEGEQISLDEELYITFLANGTFIEFQEGDQASKSKWTYNHNTMTVTTGGVAKKILRIDDKQLKFKSNMDGQTAIVTLKRVD